MFNTKNKQLVDPSRLLAFFALIILIILGMAGTALAQVATKGYGSDVQLQRGMLVQLKKDDTSKVEAVSQKTMEKLQGVVVDPNDAPVTLSSEGKKVFVATSGPFDVLVSTQNGAITAGDYITVSALDGIGMRAGTKEPVIIGRALASFDGKSNVISTTEIKDSEGKTRTVAISRVKVDVLVAKNPLLKGVEANVPEMLRRAAETIAGKPVNTVRIYISLLVFIVSTIVSGVLLYGGVRSAIISIGRNPLSKKSIIKGMIQVILVGLTIFITGIFGVYLLLKL
jgi:hypothetical protein